MSVQSDEFEDNAEDVDDVDESAEESEAYDESSLDQLRDHVIRRSIVLPEHRVLFMPTPKAACTSILWQLARLGGQDLEAFDESGLAEVSTSLTVHDMARWESQFRFSKLEPGERADLLNDPTWFRFTVVRDPASRAWSAWQSKLLLREPRFLAEWGDRPWFPRVPSEPAEVVEDFRAFCLALVDPTVEDVHWTLQTDLLGDFPFTHIGRTEALSGTIEALTAHLDTLGFEAKLHPGRENRTPLSMPKSAYDAATAKVINDRYAADFETFGYQPVKPSTAVDAAWSQTVAPVLPLLGELIDRNARIGQLSSLAHERGLARRQIAARLNRMEKRLQAKAPKKSTGGPMSPVLTNIEARADFTVRWAWDDAELIPGFTAIVRVKNEARPLPFVLPPLLRSLKRVVLVDNGSTDGTPEIAVEIAEKAGFADRLKVVSYPFDVARCGADHLGTPGDSVHSLTYFYNWSFANVTSAYALKWDGDMVLTETGVKALQDLDWQLEATQRIVTMPRYPLYVADDSTGFLDVGLANNEPWGWPNRPGFAHVKAMEWELPLWPENSPRVSLPEWSCIELKWLEEDEFAHWTNTDFAQSGRTKRKLREFQVFTSLKAGGAPPRGVIPITAPAGVHIVDYVRREWINAERESLTELAAELSAEDKSAKQAAVVAARIARRELAAAALAAVPAS